jgi:hypothetical protein
MDSRRVKYPGQQEGPTVVHSTPKVKQVKATVTDVLPAVGMAYLTGDDGRDWTVTKGTRGAGLQALRTGVKVELTIHQHRLFAFVADYTAQV